MRSFSYKYLLVVALTLASINLTAQITSTFNANAQGWTTPNDADGTISYSSTGGNPITGGFVFGSPFVFVFGAGSLYVPFDFVAPGTYLGNRSGYYNGTLSYDVQQSSTGVPNQYAEVTIANSLGIALYYFPTTPHQPAAAPSWTTFYVVLNNSLGFWKTTNSATGTSATEAEVLNVLTSLATLNIRGLYRDANTTNRLDNVWMRPAIVINTQPAASNFTCSGLPLSLTTAASGNPSITYQWQRFVLGLYTNLTNTGNYSGVTTSTLSINTTDGTATGNFRCVISGSNVVDAYTNNASVSIGTIPNAPTTTGASSCATVALTLTASGLINGQYRWYANAVGGTVLVTTTTYTTPVLSATATYYVTIFDGACESTRTPAIATINSTPVAPTTTGNSRCGNGTVALGAAGGSAGQYRWYTVATGGTAIAGQTIASYTTPSLSATTNYYVAINNGTCESARTIVIATINTIPAAPTTTGNSLCGNGTVALNAAGGSAGQYRWYTVATGGTAIAGQTIASYTTPSLSATTNYYVAINNGTCESARTIVIATINIIPAAPTTTGNSLCGNGAVALNAAGGSAGQYRWYTVATGGTAIAGQTIASYTTPSLSATTNYYVAINNGTCESARTIVIATINIIPAAPTTTGNSRCGNGTVALNAAGGSAGQYRWYTVATGGTAIAGQTIASYTTPSLSATTNYYVAINNGVCEGSRTAVVATINTLPVTPTATGNASCVAASLTLNAAGGTAGQYRWYTVATGGTAITGETNNTYSTPLLSATTTFYVSINNGTCESARTLVVATINTPPIAPTTTGNSRCGNGTVTLNAAGGSAGQYRWYSVATGGTAIAGQTIASYTTPSISATTTYYVAINNGTCEGVRTSVVATINTLPSSPTATGNSSCGSAAITINASGGVAGQYRWYTIATGGTAIAGQTNSAYTTSIISTTTTYYASINNGICESARTPVVATINSIPTTPITTDSSLCGPISFTLSATGGAAGQYRWYTQPTGGSAIAGESNSTYTTPIISSTTAYYVSIDNGTCESTRATVTATILTIGCNTIPPTISTVPLATVIEGKITLDLVPLIIAPGVLNVNSIKVKTQPSSGAFAEVVNGILTIDYKGKSFSGKELLTIEACDVGNLCSDQIFTIEVAGDIFVFNAISPNNDDKNDFFKINYIDAFSINGNTVAIFNRWGSKVFEVDNYNNSTNIFRGLNDSGNELPSGTYFYKISYDKGISTGYLELKR